jgi:hypothetical protein
MELLVLALLAGGLALASLVVGLVILGWFFALIREDQNAKSGIHDLEDGDF